MKLRNAVQVPEYDKHTGEVTAYVVIYDGQAVRLQWGSNGRIAVYTAKVTRDDTKILLGTKLWRVGELAAYIADNDVRMSVSEWHMGNSGQLIYW